MSDIFPPNHPLMVTNPPAMQEDPVPASEWVAGSILVVHIDRDFRERLRRALLGNSIVAIGTSSELTALELLRAGGISDAVLIESTRGDGDGLMLLRQIRRQRPTLPIVVLLPEDDERRRAQAASQGVFCCVTRSAETATVAAILRVALQEARLARQSGVHALPGRTLAGLWPNR